MARDDGAVGTVAMARAWRWGYGDGKAVRRANGHRRKNGRWRKNDHGNIDVGPRGAQMAIEERMAMRGRTATGIVMQECREGAGLWE